MAEKDTLLEPVDDGEYEDNNNNNNNNNNNVFIKKHPIKLHI